MCLSIEFFFSKKKALVAHFIEKKAHPNAQFQKTNYFFQDLLQKVPYCLDEDWICHLR